ncbi:helix-turn-helix domain-containing protein [Tsukamurella sputi]|uniref:Helix-turn-helix domain-containing protein n=1 Tax=Tsukamurella sputi TaxID=2591848 RepID=A0A5C5RGS1_9ACTN|nr:helix-turn-helix domain-containing protein [Tsukamurella sputi]
MSIDHPRTLSSFHLLDVLAEADQPVTKTVLQSATGLSAATVDQATTMFVRLGFVRRPFRGRYVITEAGRAHLTELAQ